MDKRNIKLEKENSFLRTRLLLKQELMNARKLINVIDKEIKAPTIESWIKRMIERHDNTDHIFKISGERI
jgi:hypothetical protein